MAGLFYPGQADRCRAVAEELLSTARSEMMKKVGGWRSEAKALGAIVPHAGWVCSGAIAAEAIIALSQQRPTVDLVVVFGAIHTSAPIELGVLDSHGIWAIPGAQLAVRNALRDELAGDERRFVVDDRFHLREHAVEVELPLIREAWPKAQILPIETPPNQQAVRMGEQVARKISEVGLSAVYLASSDLTHYGLDYGFTPAGVGETGLKWALENDRRLLDVIAKMEADRVVPEAAAHSNACGAGAIAAMLGACGESGARRAFVLRHQNSYQILAQVMPQEPTNAVGYAAVWVG